MFCTYLALKFADVYILNDILKCVFHDVSFCD
jgi:hypothetical protein